MTNYIGNTVPGDFYHDHDTDNELQRPGPRPLRPVKKGPIRAAVWGALFLGTVLAVSNWAASNAATNLTLLRTPVSPLSAPAPTDLISAKAPTIMYIGTFFGVSNLNFSDNSLKDRLTKWIAPGIPPSFIEHAEITPALIPLTENFFKRGGRELIVEAAEERWVPVDSSINRSGIFMALNPNAAFEPLNTPTSTRLDGEHIVNVLKQLQEIATSNLGTVTTVIVPALNFRFSPTGIAKISALKTTLQTAGIQYVDFGTVAKAANPLILTSHQLNGWPSEYAHKLMFELIEQKLTGRGLTS